MLEKFRQSLKLKMLLLFGGLVFVACAVLAGVSLYEADQAVKQEAEEAMLKVAAQTGQTVEERLNARLMVLDTIANRNVIRGMSGGKETTLEEKIAALQQEMGRLQEQGFKYLGLADREGNLVLTTGQRINIADRDYFQKAMQGKSNLSSVVVSRIDNALSIHYACPVRHYATGEITGVVVGVVDAKKISDLISKVSYAQTGYAFIVDSAGKTIAHRDYSRVEAGENILEKAKTDPSLASLAEIVSRMAKGEEGKGVYTYQGEEKLVCYTPIKLTGWSLAMAAPVSEILVRTASLERGIILVSLVLILLALGVAYFVAQMLVNPLVLAVDHLGLIAKGDFTMPIPDQYLKMKDEVGRIAQAIDALQNQMRPVLRSITESSKSVAANSESLSAVSQQIAASSNEAAQAIQHVAQGAAEQTGYLQEILRLVNNITANLDNIYRRLTLVRENTERSAAQADRGKKDLDGLIYSIGEVRKSFQAVTENVSSLGSSVNQVGEIVEAINNIANQTNLLALNAAIEAARAGEAGRGFAVVAEEVRKLAEQSQSSAAHIKDLLAGIQNQTAAVVTASSEVTRQTESQLASVERTVLAFNDVLASVGEVAPLIKETYAAVEDTVKSKDVVLERVQGVSAVAEETSASAEEIAASAQELSASTEEIASTAQELAKVAERLEKEVGIFKV